MNNHPLKDRCALVTGAGAKRGMGRAIAIGLARAGAAVGCADVDTALAQDVAATIEGEGGKAMAITMDVTSAAHVDEGMARFVEQFGALDILINNAGIAHFAFMLELEESDWDRVMDVNLKGTFLCARAAGRQMVRQGRGGNIINIGSISARAAGARKIHYCISKAGMHMLTLGLSLELGEHNIRVNEIAPGDIDTDIVKQEHIRQIVQNSDMAGKVPLGRRGCAQDVVGAAIFLASDEASYITGATINVDGGITTGTRLAK